MPFQGDAGLWRWVDAPLGGGGGGGGGSRRQGGGESADPIFFCESPFVGTSYISEGPSEGTKTGLQTPRANR
jgi:hypothetical protein